MGAARVQRGGGGSALATAIAVLAALFVVAGAVPAAAAVNEEPLLRFGSKGSEAGQLEIPEAIDADPVTGDVYVGGIGGSNRIDEFTPWGKFVKAFGWDVAPGAVNEVQEVRMRAEKGSFELGFEGQSTPDLPLGASGAQVEGALDALTTIGGAGGSVSVEARTGATNGVIPFIYVITFKGSLEGTDVPQLEAVEGSEPLEGGQPTSVLEARTRVEGAAATHTGLEDCTAESGCQAGSEGGGAGQVISAFGLAVDAEGDVFVREFTNNRVQKFSPAGRFLLAFGGEVNKTKSEEGGSSEVERNLCAAASGDVCQAGHAGTGQGEFEGGLGIGVIGTTVYVADKGRIQEFNLQGHYEGNLPDPEGVLAGKTVRRLTADPREGRLYLTFNGENDVAALAASSGQRAGAVRTVREPGTLAIDGAGDLFAVEGLVPHHRPQHVTEFDPAGQRLIPDEGEEEECKTIEETTIEDQCPLFAAPETGYALRGIGPGPGGDLYVANVGADSYVRAFGPPPLDFEAPPPTAPTIESQYASAVTDTDAQLRVVVNPHFFAGTLGTTTYYVQYGTAACVEAGGWEAACVSETPAPPGAKLQAGIVDEDVTSAPVALSELAPRTEYRYRFVVEGSGAPGAPVDDEAASFRTYPGAGEGAAGACPNEAFRSGPSGALADCRAYEMVSPVDKEGGEVRALLTVQTGQPAVLDQAAASGAKLAYGSYRPFAGAESAPFTTQYIATRGAAGWESRAISPPKTTQILIPLGTFDTEFRLFSEDLCEAWLQTFAEPTLSAAAPPEYTNLYRRGLCPAGSYEALTTAAPTNVPKPNYEAELQGISSDGSVSAFAALGKLSGEAPDLSGLGGVSPLLYVYRRGEAQPRFACFGPEGVAIAAPCTAGGPARSNTKNRQVRVEHALSEDGSKLYWTQATSVAGLGHIYLRENPTEPQSALAHGYASGKGKVSNGSTQVTKLLAAAGKATLSEGSTELTAVQVSTGRFQVGQPISATGIPAGASVTAVGEGTLMISAAVESGKSASGVAIASAGPEPFAVGQSISGEGIPAGTTITAVAPGELTLSQAASKTKSEDALSATSECSEAQMACTLPVSQAAEEEIGASGNSQYWGATPDGSVAIFTSGPEANPTLFEYEAATRTTRRIAGGVQGVAGMSEDASRIYFVSEEKIAGSGENQDEEEALAGEPNLYLRNGGAGGANIRFVATLAGADAVQRQGKGKSSPVSVSPAGRATRTSADGGQLAFMSFAPLTGYDNRDLANGERDAEVFLYDAEANGGAGRLVCASCNPSGGRPAGLNRSETALFWIAGQIPVAENNLHESRVLSADGQRLFFESPDALSPSDSNGAMDVYEWEQAGEGNCSAQSQSYSSQDEGCVNLISSGKSQVASEFAEADPSGRNVFFTTLSSLVPQDPGVLDVYDAREDGGLPPPPQSPAQCEGEACQPSAQDPAPKTPSSSTFHGPGNAKPAQAKKSKKCPKGKAKRGGRCVKKPAVKKQKPRKHGRRAGR